MGLRNGTDVVLSGPLLRTVAKMRYARSLTRKHRSRESVDPRDPTRDQVGVFIENFIRKIHSCRLPEYSTLRFLRQVVEHLTYELLKWE
jgi:hypothetical protein